MLAATALRTRLENIFRDCVEIVPFVLQKVIRMGRNAL